MKVLTAAIIALLLTHNSAHAQKLPASTTIGTNPAGTAFYAVSAGLAKVISGAGPMQSMVQPYTGSSTFLPLLDSGEIDFGIVNAVEMNLGYQGPAKLKISGKNPLPHVPNTRLIMRGSPLSVSLVVRKDSPMKMVHDIKGKRVTGEYPRISRSGTMSTPSWRTRGLPGTMSKSCPFPPSTTASTRWFRDAPTSAITPSASPK